MSKHFAVWIDHHEARIFDVHADPLRHHHAAEEVTVIAPTHAHRHQRGHDGEGHIHPEDAGHFFDEVRDRLTGGDAVLVLGPSSAKHEFTAHLEKHDRGLAAKVIGVETVDHPTGPQIVARAADAFLKNRLFE